MLSIHHIMTYLFLLTCQGHLCIQKARFSYPQVSHSITPPLFFFPSLTSFIVFSQNFLAQIIVVIWLPSLPLTDSETSLYSVSHKDVCVLSGQWFSAEPIPVHDALILNSGCSAGLRPAA